MDSVHAATSTEVATRYNIQGAVSYRHEFSGDCDHAMCNIQNRTIQVA
jgi:hypothetical protein